MLDAENKRDMTKDVFDALERTIQLKELNMEVKAILELIQTGTYQSLPMGSSTSRVELLEVIGEAEGINLLNNGGYEFYKKNQVIFYIGNVARGSLRAVRIFNLEELDIYYSEIVDFVQKNNINYSVSDDGMILTLGNDTKIFFQDSGNEQKVVYQIIISTISVFEERILKVPC
jgi:hypothetical protein